MNWDKIIDAADARGGFTDINKARAADWETCPCGEQDPRIPRDSDEGYPLDHQLLELGLEFAAAVESDDVAYARTLLAAIERRAAEVLARLGE